MGPISISGLLVKRLKMKFSYLQTTRILKLVLLHFRQDPGTLFAFESLKYKSNLETKISQN